jgi:hypothetical protein
MQGGIGLGDGGMVNDINRPGDIEQDGDKYNTRDYLWNSRQPLQIESSSLCRYFSTMRHGMVMVGLPLSGSRVQDLQRRMCLPDGVPAYTGDVENWPYNPIRCIHVALARR